MAGFLKRLFAAGEKTSLSGGAAETDETLKVSKPADSGDHLRPDEWSHPQQNTGSDADTGPRFGDKDESVGRSVLAEGDELGGFRLKELIGKGGMGDVWKAHDPVADRWVAIKLVPQGVQNAAAEMTRLKEAFQRVQALHHQHICPFYLLGEDAGHGYFLVTQCVDGGTLSWYRSRYVARHGSFPLDEVVRLLRPVAEALDYAHSNNVVHRDIKPSNVMVTGGGEDVQIIDFGLAAEIRTSLSRLTNLRMEGSGTPPYMAPEQWLGEYQDARTDQYALAVMAFELLAGELPFKATNSEALRLCVLNDPVPVLKGQPEYVNRALARGMAKRRTDRFANCQGFVAALAGRKRSRVGRWIAALLVAFVCSLAALAVIWRPWIPGELPQSLEDGRGQLAVDSRKQQAKRASESGLAHSKRGEHRDALLRYQEAERLDPECATYPYNTGNMLFKLAKYDEAENAFGRAIKLSPRHVLSYYMLGNTRHQKGDLATAMTDYLTTIELNPPLDRLATVYFGLYRLHRQQGEDDKAWQYLDECRESADADLRSRLPKLARLLSLHTALGRPQRNEFYSTHYGTLQTYSQYVNFSGSTPNVDKGFIYIQPLGDLSSTERDIVRLAADFLGIYFDCPVKLQPDVRLKALPPTAVRKHSNSRVEQVHTSYLREHVLHSGGPPDMVTRIGITNRDLWPGDKYNYCFGQASASNRVAVCSIYRFGDPGDSRQAFERCLRRTCKIASYVTCQVLQMRTCILYECNMAGCSHIVERDDRPLPLCPHCLAKLCHATGADPIRRFERLAAFCSVQGLKPEEGFWRRSLAAIRTESRSE